MEWPNAHAHIYEDTQTQQICIYIYEKERKKITKGIGRRKEMSKRKKHVAS